MAATENTAKFYELGRANDHEIAISYRPDIRIAVADELFAMQLHAWARLSVNEYFFDAASRVGEVSVKDESFCDAASRVGEVSVKDNISESMQLHAWAKCRTSLFRCSFTRRSVG